MRIWSWKKFINTIQRQGRIFQGSNATTMAKCTRSLPPRGPHPLQGMPLRSPPVDNCKCLRPLLEYVWHYKRECLENIVNWDVHGEIHPYHNAVHSDRLAKLVRARHIATACLDGHGHSCHEREHESSLRTRSHWMK